MPRFIPLVTAAGLLGVQTRMGADEFGALGNGTKRDPDKRLVGIFRPSAPADRQPLRLQDLEIFAAAFMLRGVEHAEATADT